MTRQWLALIALLTGLAAVGAPVNAQSAEALSCEIGASAEASSESAPCLASLREPLISPFKFVAELQNFEASSAQKMPHQAVLIGIDRAHI